MVSGSEQQVDDVGAQQLQLNIQTDQTERMFSLLAAVVSSLGELAEVVKVIRRKMDTVVGAYQEQDDKT